MIIASFVQIKIFLVAIAVQKVNARSLQPYAQIHSGVMYQTIWNISYVQMKKNVEHVTFILQWLNF